MAEVHDPNDRRRDPAATTTTPAVTNPSLESTRMDDAHNAEHREAATELGTVVGAGLGCVGMTLLPWVMVAVGVVAAVGISVIYKGCQG